LTHCTIVPYRLSVLLTTFEGRLVFVRGLRRYGSRELGRLAGLSEAAVSKLEHSGADPKLSTLTVLARVLKCEPAWLAWGEGVAPQETEADRRRMPPSSAPRGQFITVRRTTPKEPSSRRTGKRVAGGSRG